MTTVPAARLPESVFIANRGEISLRVARTCRELGIHTIAAHSTADRDSAAVRYADTAVQIGPAAARRSYLNAYALVQAAVQTGAEAVHPGYGFLSEDADFARACESQGLLFVGPPSEVIALLGDKGAARRTAAEAGVPILPGSPDACGTTSEATRIAGEIGYPVVIKAVAGGGGRGITLVRDAAAFPTAYRAARAAAQALFGDGRVLVEKYVETARHVEVQILADAHGNVVHLGERDCSVQRNRQKLIEESPAPALPGALLDEMAAAAVAIARAVGYVGAGTVEFLVDQNHQFHFLEVNCRIQVEHPVTELATGLDIVREQLLVAGGFPLSFGQDAVVRRGTAIECRVNTEDPARGFLPTPGRLTEFAPPAGPFTRVDTHGFPGCEVTADYDSLLAKVAVWAPDRPTAIARMERALGEFRVSGAGMHTTLPLLREVLAHPLFQDGKHTTMLIDQMVGDNTPGRPAL